MRAIIPEEETAGRKIVLPNVNERRQVHILNPAAGKRKLYEAAKRTIGEIGGEIMTSDRPGQIEELVRELFCRDPFAHAIVYGGDGTVYEAVNGLMNSGASETASFSVIPGGSGNDFSAYANDSGDFVKTELSRIDLIKTESGGVTRYFANIMNVGFDCAVVHETYSLKKFPLFTGKTSYIAGVVKTLAAKKTIHAKIKLEGVVNLSGNPLPDRDIEQELLLAAFANARYYGGGFKAAPLASITDGAMDVLAINDVTRREFVSLIGDYREGTYIHPSGQLKKKFDDVVSFFRCRKITLSGVERFCLDGEIFPASDSISAEVIPSAAWFAAL